MIRTALDTILFNDADITGAGDSTPIPPQAPAPASAPQQEYTPSTSFLEPGAPAGLDPNIVIQQLAAQQAQQTQVLSQLAQTVGSLARAPGIAEVDTRSPEEKKIDELNKKVESLSDYYSRQQQTQIEQAVLGDANSVLDQLIQQDPLVANNPELANFCKNAVLASVRSNVREKGMNHNLTTTAVAHLYRNTAELQKRIIQSHPGFAANVAEQQKIVNNRAVDAPGSTSPAPGDGTAPLDPDGDDYWQNKKGKLAAAWNNVGGQ